MADKLEIRVIGREIVKPSSPTPAHLSRFNLSLLDQCTDDRFVPFTWFYSGNGTGQFPKKCRELKSSLAQTLTLFYPMAGRIRDPNDQWVDCCDDGVEFVEAQMNCSMTRILGSTDPDVLKLLVPVDPGSPVMTWNRKTDDQSLCVFQATLFECGGVAVTVCLTHKLADGATYFAFTRAWGAIATRSGPAVEPLPRTGLSSILPPLPGAGKPSVASNLSSVSSVVTRRFAFSAAKTEELKAVASSGVAVRRSTRVEAVTALLWKCAVAASRSVKRSSSSSTTGRSAACVAMNLRKRLPATVVPENTIGNLVGAAFATSEMGDDVSLPEVVTELRKAVEAVSQRLQGGGDDYKEMISTASFEVGANEVLMTGLVDLECSYMFTSVCGSLPISLDLGFGRSVWVTPILSNKNTVLLMDNMEDEEDEEQLQRGGGVQALVTLGEQEMEFFQHHQLLLSFAASHHPINHHLPLKSNL